MTQKAMAVPLEATARCGVDDGPGGARRRSRVPVVERGRGSIGGGGSPERERGSERGSGGVVALSGRDEEEPGRQLPAWRAVAPCSALPLPAGRG